MLKLKKRKVNKKLIHTEELDKKSKVEKIKTKVEENLNLKTETNISKRVKNGYVIKGTRRVAMHLWYLQKWKKYIDITIEEKQKMGNL